MREPTIHYVIYEGHLGDDNDEESNERYREAVEKAIQGNWREASVTVEMVRGTGYRNGWTTGFDDDQEILQECSSIANEIWGMSNY